MNLNPGRCVSSKCNLVSAVPLYPRMLLLLQIHTLLKASLCVDACFVSVCALSHTANRVQPSSPAGHSSRIYIVTLLEPLCRRYWASDAVHAIWTPMMHKCSTAPCLNLSLCNPRTCSILPIATDTVDVINLIKTTDHKTFFLNLLMVLYGRVINFSCVQEANL